MCICVHSPKNDLKYQKYGLPIFCHKFIDKVTFEGSSYFEF